MPPRCPHRERIALADRAAEDGALVLSRSEPAQSSSPSALHRCATLAELLTRDGLRTAAADSTGEGGFDSTWRISPTPYLLSPDDLARFEALGPRLLAFYRSLNRLYQESVRGTQPAWVAGYLDRGKPESLITYSRMNRFKSLIPQVIRPDVLPTDQGLVITELDSVPGGIGLTAALGRHYAQLGEPTPQIVGGAEGMVDGFRRMLLSLAGPETGVLVIVVSDEAKDYRAEMQWLARELTRTGLESYCVEPREVTFTETGLWITAGEHTRPVRFLYRFFELFDLKNIPKAELIMYSVKKGQVAATPPFKPVFEEKLAFALFHHPRLTAFWERDLGAETYAALQQVLPRTWILDPRPIPPSAVIPHLTMGGQPVDDWMQVADAGQKDRQLVIKPSGFSELAWGSRGVSIGHDMPQADWRQAVTAGLAAFEQSPHILQTFSKSRSVRMEYHDSREDRLETMQGRARLCPYYFVAGDEVRLGGILATVCPADKKILHGMRDAIMAPCAVGPASPAPTPAVARA